MKQRTMMDIEKTLRIYLRQIRFNLSETGMANTTYDSCVILPGLLL